MPLTVLDEHIQSLKKYNSAAQWAIDTSKNNPRNKELQIRNRENIIRGCETNLWIDGSIEDDVWQFVFDTDSDMTRATATVVTGVVSGMETNDILELEFKDFENFAQYFSFNRKRGIQLMLNHIQKVIDNHDSTIV